MDYFNYKNGELHAENVSIRDIVRDYGSPVYIYSKATIERHWNAFKSELKDYNHQICYAVKANGNLSVLQTLVKLGSGFDVVSLGEIKKALYAGADPNKIVFSGLGKQENEISEALKIGIGCFNVESEAELYRLASIAQDLNILAPMSIRVNPNVDAHTHPYIATGLKENKFGVDENTAIKLYQWANKHPWLNPIGIDCHIGSQLTELSPYIESLDKLLNIVNKLKHMGIIIHEIDLGGGLGVSYNKETPPNPQDLCKAIIKKLNDFDGPKLKLILEPGRSIMANAGVLITKVEYVKTGVHKNFLIVDSAMNDLIRPALYKAWLEVIPVLQDENKIENYLLWDIVGPVCESADFLAKDRKLNVAQSDLICIRSAGAYSFCMSSNYNARNRSAEIMVDNDKSYLVRKRETFEDQIRLESLYL